MKQFVLLLMLVVLGSLTLNAGTFEHKKAGISIWFPDNWTTTTDEGVLEAEAPDEDAFAQLMVLDNVESLNQAVDAYTEELGGIFENLEITTDGEEVTYNGLNFYIVEGVGDVNGVKMELSIALIGTKNSVVMTIMFNPQMVAKKYEKTFTQIIQSIKAI